MIDTLSEKGAKVLMETIRKYWREEGYELPILHLEPISGKNRDALFAVRSDMVNGRPERRSFWRAA